MKFSLGYSGSNSGRVQLGLQYVFVGCKEQIRLPFTQLNDAELYTGGAEALNDNPKQYRILSLDGSVFIFRLIVAE